MSQYILALDQGTTNIRAMLVNKVGHIIAHAESGFKQYFPQEGWVEHDAEEIWDTVLSVANAVLKQQQLSASDIAAIGITNQRETTFVWNRLTGEVIYHAIVWQDRRTAPLCDRLREHEAWVQARTGLCMDPYFSATKLAWILDNVPGARAQAEAGELLFGTADCFLLWRLTRGKVHATDATNASRTLLFNIVTQQWDADLLKLFNIPASMLPEVKDCSAEFGVTDSQWLGGAIPILGVAGDQQAALIGQACFQPGMAKTTYGTGCFMVLNTGETLVHSRNHLISTVAYRLEGKTCYALEGSIFMAGAIIQWLRDQASILESAADSEKLAQLVPDNGGVYFVPAFTGLGAPYWNPHARAAIMGLTRDSSVRHIVRAALEAVGYQTRDLLAAMQADYPKRLTTLRVDGGMVANNWLCQFLADILQVPVARPSEIETTVLGVAYLAGLKLKWFDNLNDIQACWRREALFKPDATKEDADALYLKWQKAVERVL